MVNNKYALFKVLPPNADKTDKAIISHDGIDYSIIWISSNLDEMKTTLKEVQDSINAFLVLAEVEQQYIKICKIINL